MGLSVPFWPVSIAHPDIQYLNDIARGEEIKIVETSTAVNNTNKSEINDWLIVPKINVKMPLVLSENAKALNIGGWVFPISTPDKGGNTVIFGHRFKYLPPVANTFYRLDEVGIGDDIQVTWKGENYNYVVIETKIVQPTELSVLNQSNEPIVTLITCTPLFTSKERLVVIGSLVR